LIATSINTATRTFHTELNRLIIARLPLALPPHAETPLLYAIGIRAFARVYDALESAWDAALEDRKVDGELRNELDRMMMPEIRRREGFKRDLRHAETLLSQPEEAAHFQQAKAQPMSKTDEHIRSIRPAILDKPHVIIAYAWVMYMALFSGGRWIRMVLKEPGPEFWGHRDEGSTDGFSFLTFLGEHDGEDIKARFKEQLGVVEGLLSQKQKEEVVEEAKVIFKASLDMVRELDEVVGSLVADIGTQRHTSATDEKTEKPAKIVRKVLRVEKMPKKAMPAPLQLLFAMALCFLALTILDSSKRVALLTKLFPRSSSPQAGVL
jgi:heme oxygenase